MLYLQVEDPVNASYGITDYRFAATQLAQTTTRAVIGLLELDRTFEEREEINSRVVKVMQEVEDQWGVQVKRFEVKNIVPPPSVRESMEKQMSAERERRALISQSEGQRQSQIDKSEGVKMQLINQSEGEMQRRINEAEGGLTRSRQSGVRPRSRSRRWLRPSRSRGERTRCGCVSARSIFAALLTWRTRRQRWCSRQT